MIAGLVFFGAYAVVAFKILAAGAEVQSAASPPVKESLQRVCVTCHVLEQITSSRCSRSQWEDLINRMIERG
jgi:cytochrome c553